MRPPKFINFAVVTLLTAQGTLAESPATLVAGANAAQATPKTLSLDVDLSMSGNRQAEEMAEADRSSQIDMTITKKLNPELSASINAGGTQKTTGYKEAYMQNTALILSYSRLAIPDRLKLTLSAKGLLPTNPRDREEKSLQGATGLKVAAATELSVLGRALALHLSIEGAKNYHRFETSSMGDANVSYRARVGVGAQLELPAHLGLSLGGYYQAGRTYENALRTAYGLSQEINFSATPTLALYFEHSNQGDALKADGMESNIEIIDENASVLTLGIRATF